MVNNIKTVTDKLRKDASDANEAAEKRLLKVTGAK
jgi:hypothetical protein